MTHRFFTQQVGSDRYPYEVIEKVNDSHYIVKEMDFDYDYPSGDCYNFKSRPTNREVHIRRHKDGRFYEPRTNWSTYYPTEEPEAYRDPSF